MFKRHAPGQRLNKIPARAMNELYELLEERTRRGADILRGDSAEIMVKNNTGDVLQMFDLCAVGDVLHTPTENEHEFRGVNIFKGNTPSASSLIAIVQEPISDGGIGRAVVQGVTPCRLNVTASGDTHAGPTTSVTQLTTGTSGPAVILWKESGTGANKKAKVLLLGQQGTGGGGGGGSGGGGCCGDDSNTEYHPTDAPFTDTFEIRRAFGSGTVTTSGLDCTWRSDFSRSRQRQAGAQVFWTHIMVCEASVDIRDGSTRGAGGTIYSYADGDEVRIPSGASSPRFVVAWVETVNKGASGPDLYEYKRVYLHRHTA